MLERFTERSGLGSSASLDEARVQLEGAIEIVEAARDFYRSLADACSAPGWRRRLRGMAPHFTRAADWEPEVEAALQQVERRAAIEAWPVGHPVLRKTERVRAERKRLHGWACQRAAELGFMPGSQDFASLLGALGAERNGPGQSASEPIVADHTADMGPVSPILCVLLGGGITGIAALGSAALQGSAPTPWAIAPLFIGMSAAVLLGLLRWFGTRYWLTRRSLTVMRRFGEPTTISLSSIAEEGLRLGPMGLWARVAGDSKTTLWGPPLLWALAARVEILRRAPAGIEGTPVEDVQIVEEAMHVKTWTTSNSWPVGVAVIRPDCVAFMPARSGARALSILASKGDDWRPSVPISLVVFLDLLRYRGAHAFDMLLARIAPACGGFWWPRDITKCEATFFPGGLRNWPRRDGDVFAAVFSANGREIFAKVPSPSPVFAKWLPKESR